MCSCRAVLCCAAIGPNGQRLKLCNQEKSQNVTPFTFVTVSENKLKHCFRKLLGKSAQAQSSRKGCCHQKTDCEIGLPSEHVEGALRMVPHTQSQEYLLPSASPGLLTHWRQQIPQIHCRKCSNIVSCFSLPLLSSTVY